jgi:glycosyltransferase involved in cell wall biosynthesis
MTARPQISPGEDATSSSTLVSVLMPMKNPGGFLAAAIESVLSQDHRELELVVIDDGSTDGSKDYVAALSDDRVKLIDGPRTGISDCLNTGLARMRGQLFMRCDADDLFPSGRIAGQVLWMEQHPECVAVCGGFSMISSDGSIVAAPFKDAVDVHLDAAKRILRGDLKTHLCAFAFRTEAVRQIGGFRPFFETAEDIDFTLRLAATGLIGFEPRNAYQYRLHDASITHTQVSMRRRFFEEAAYSMSRDRQASGSDDLMRGNAPQVPAESSRRARPDGAGRHMAQLLVGESWASFERGDRPAAKAAALRAIKARLTHRDAWKALLLVSTRALPRESQAE